MKKTIPHYYAILIGIIVVAVCFFAGFKAGLFLFSNTRINTDNELINTDILQAKANNQYESVQNPQESVALKNYCDSNTQFSEESDKNLCSQKSKIGGAKGLEINLTNQKALLYENGKITAIYPLAYQSREGKWFQAPTGYYFAGVKWKEHTSSIFPVTMPFAFQYYQDFFIHGIPYYQNGDPVASQFTGGCLRFENSIAEKIFNWINSGDEILVFKTFDDLKLKSDFAAPVDLANAWIRQRFNNPYRTAWSFSGTEFLKFDYDQHAGIDFALNSDAKDKSVYSVADGKVVFAQTIGELDHGFGNTVIIKHDISSSTPSTPSTSSGQVNSGQVVYSLYAHLSSIDTGIEKGVIIKKGEKIGEIGNSGYGCDNYWKVGKDGCPSTSSGQVAGIPDTHLHFELKTTPILTNPEGGDACLQKDGSLGPCFGYTPDNPEDYGYFNPIEFLFEKSQITNSKSQTITNS